MRAKSECQLIPDDQALRRKENQSLVNAIVGSKIFKTYEAAFTQATGLPVSLRPIEAWQLPLHGKTNENPLCAAMADESRTCGYCLQVQQELTERACKGPHTIQCEMGLNCTSVPVRLEPVSAGYGENTLVWVIDNADTSSYRELEAPAADTLYNVALSNVLVSGAARNFSYSVTIFDPAAAPGKCSPGSRRSPCRRRTVPARSSPT
jgi:hypothetical protein